MRVLILSDIHANLIALESVLQAAKNRYDELWCLGDIVGYGPRPNECVDLLRDLAKICVIGNHDWAALGRPGIDVDDFNPVARQAILWTQEQLTSASRAYLENLSDTPLQPRPEISLLLTHASPREPVWEYILTPAVALENFAAFQQEICLVGHTHKPIIYQWTCREREIVTTAHGGTSGAELTAAEAAEETPQPARYAAEKEDAPRQANNAVMQTWAVVNALQMLPNTSLNLTTSSTHRLIVNPGSVGQPRDQDIRAAYALLDLETMTWRHERITYPVELTQSQMRAANLPQRLIDRLNFGW
jgi:predicted phosphodiesterase